MSSSVTRPEESSETPSSEESGSSSDAAGRGLLANLPLLEGLPDEVRSLIERCFVPVELEFGEAVVHQGDPPDAYYVIVAGTARVVIENEDGHEVSLNVLGPGDAFGEAALLEGTPRTATVRASHPLTVLRLDRGVFQALVDTYPSVGEAFSLNARTRRVNDFLRLHSAFSVLDRDETIRLIEVLEELELSDGEAAVVQGEQADALYLIQEGRLGVWIEIPDEEPRRVRTLHAGEFFGELALVRGTERTATVRAEGPAKLLRLSAERFQRLIASQPQFAARVRERIALYDAFDRAQKAQAAPRAPAEVEVWNASDPGLAVSDTGDEVAVGAPAQMARRRFPFVRQIDEMDCGAACTAMVCRAFGHDVSMTSIRYAVGTSTDGTTLRGLVRGGEEIGLHVRAIKSSPDRIDELPLPAIIHWGGNHWVVAYRLKGEKVRIADPGRGLRSVSREELAEKWSGYCALLEPTERLAEAPRGGLDLRWMWPFVAPHKKRIALAVVLAVLVAGLVMLVPVFAGVITDRVVRGHDENLLYILGAGMLALIVFAVIFTIAQRYLLARVATHVDADTLDFISGRLLRLPMRYFEARRVGDIERRISGMRQVRTVLIQNGVAALTALTQLIVALVIMFIYSPVLALLYVACAPLYAGLMRYSERRLRPAFDAVEEGQGRYTSRQIDAIRGIEAVKVMGAEEGLRRRMAGEFYLLRDKLFRADVIAMVYEGLVSIVTFFIYALFLFVGAWEVLHHNLSIGGLVGFTGLVLLANGPIAILLDLWDRLQLVTVVLGRLQDVFEQEPEQGHDHSALAPVPSLEGHIRLRRVGFVYPATPDRPILEEISLDVPPGTTVALVGRSGSGKSTLVKCLAGLLVPTAGTIEYDGVELRRLRFAELRSRIGFVLQSPFIFDDTVAANIAFGDENPEPAKIQAAAEIANAADFIERLPLRYETRIGDSGMRLSGGQAQRISIARALYHQPPVVIFDEATSALDTEAERAVKQNMDRVLEGRTAFVIAHRLSTIRDADVVCVLEQGRLVEHGTHEELLERQGLYAYLHSQQLDN
jgi:ABC-type bacteriocin/lantibiotic exporter with double-glycine peptidase domain/CRP-like cAMP-binding protein